LVGFQSGIKARSASCSAMQGLPQKVALLTAEVDIVWPVGSLYGEL